MFEQCVHWPPTLFVTPSTETIATFCHLHPLVEVDLPPFVNNFHLETNLVLDKKIFIFTLTCFPHLSSNDPSSMVYELLWDCFDPNDFANGFDFFFKHVGTSLVVMFFHQYHASYCITIIGFGETS